MRIRFGNLKDKKEYLKTQKEAFPSIDSTRDARLFDAKVNKKEIFVIESYTGYAGHICFHPYFIEPPFAPSIFIEEMAIKNRYRGKGLGKMLLNHLIQYSKSKKISIIYLSTNDSINNNAIKFYEHFGFKKIGNLEDINPKSEYKHRQLFFGEIVK